MRLLLVLLLLSLVSCSNGDASADATEAPPPAADEPLRPLRLADLATACDGQGVPRAAAYPADPAEPPRLLVLVRDSTGAAYRAETSETYFRDWGVYGSDAYPETEVVACLTGFPGAFARTCEFNSRASDSTYVLDLYAASYNVRLRAARTGELLGEFGLDASDRNCPLMHTFAGDGTRERTLIAPPTQDLKDGLLARLAPDYDPRREFMDADEIRALDSLEAITDSLRRLR